MENLYDLKLELVGLKIAIELNEGLYNQLKNDLRKSGLLETDFDKSLNLTIGKDDTESSMERKINIMKLLSKIHALKDKYVETCEKIEKLSK